MLPGAKGLRRSHCPCFDSLSMGSGMSYTKLSSLPVSMQLGRCKPLCLQVMYRSESPHLMGLYRPDK